MSSVSHPTSHSVNEFLKDCFTTHGIPDILESDNGPQYNSEEFRHFTRSWKIKHLTSSPHYPKSNGLAERYVQEAKLLLKRCKIEHVDYRLALLNLRNTPRSNLSSPAQRLFGRPTRTLIPIHPSKRLPRESISTPLQMEREKQRLAATSSNDSPFFVEGEKVKLKISPRNWIPAKISGTVDAPRSYLVTTPDGKTFRRNSSVIRPTEAAIPPNREIVVNMPPPPPESVPARHVLSTPANAVSPKANNLSKTVTTRSGRIVRPPERLVL